MKETYAYAAGLFDGEGTVTLAKDGAKAVFRHPVLSMTSTTYALVLFMQQTFGGHICRHAARKEKHSEAWSWRVTSRTALDAAKLLHPYIREPEKIRRVELLLTQYAKVTIRNGKYSPEELLLKKCFEHEFFHPSEPFNVETASMSL